MCGFAGFLDLSRRANAETLGTTVRGMADTLRHRGPDDSGEWVDPSAGLALGFRRLSILDLSQEGHQPMLSRKGRYVLTFNGEIYNFQAVRQELEKTTSPPVFRGHSDTEIMLAAIEHWGLERALESFVGMFGIALWDRQERTLYLGRDRMGEKPVYYGWAGSVFLFGSELKALSAHPCFRSEVDREALGYYIRTGYVPTPRCIYRGIRKLPPATFLKLSEPRPGVFPNPVPYWSLDEAAVTGAGAPLPGGEGGAVEALEQQLNETIRREMVADVPVGAFLSGGIDSTLVVALMQKVSPRPVKSFTIGFRETNYDEANYAQAVAQHLGTDHTELYVTPTEARAVIPRLPLIYDEPFADSSAIPVFLVSQLARRSVTVSLSGDGGDELFGGYPWYARTRRLWQRCCWLPGPFRRAAAALLERSPSHSFNRPRALGELLARANSPHHLHFWLRSMWHGYPHLVLPSGDKSLPEPPSLPGSLDLITSLLRLDMATYLPDDILTKVDRASMAVSLESRAPLLDHHLVELSFRVPLSLKLHQGTGKWILRRLLSRHVPEEMLDRPKRGFSVPIGIWLREPLRDWAEDLLAQKRLQEEGFLDPEPIRNRWQEHLAGQRNWGDALWHVLMFQAWLKK
jgi:asparagine synthase (glutamine-hydrolysing)